jgi:DNA polymerase elongation subunit (family B)
MRDPGNKFQINDRVPFVYVVKKSSLLSGKNKNILQGDLIETPEYVIKNKLPIDYLFYLENQIMNPCIQILELLIKNPEKIFDEYISKEMSKRLGRQDINKFITNHDQDNDNVNDNNNDEDFDISM